ncbi:cation-translocating P-type ATPase C-terminal domain-containing protein [Streptomyces radiopugnans]|nr:cation-translocating P-type ATPase C-terminal domain-containing protein [Streptomyces radiopugnans]
MALASVVGTQLAQTLLTGGLDRNVLTAGIGSAAALVGVIQTPGVSQFFGCTPLGPVAWGITLGSITTATLLGAAAAPVVRRLAPDPADWSPPELRPGTRSPRSGRGSEPERQGGVRHAVRPLPLSLSSPSPLPPLRPSPPGRTERVTPRARENRGP